AIVLSEFGGAARRSDGSLAELCERARQPQRAPSRLAIIYVHEIFARLKLLVASDVGDRRDWTEQHPALEGLLIDFSLGHGHEERLDRVFHLVHFLPVLLGHLHEHAWNP